MNVLVRLALSLMVIAAAYALPLAAHAQDETQPTFVKGKYDTPLDREAVEQDWVRLGYSNCRFSGKGEGWTKGEHTHEWHTLFAGLEGKMEFIINDKRFVLEAGDELYYPKGEVMAARNLNDGRSEWFECLKYQ